VSAFLSKSTIFAFFVISNYQAAAQDFTSNLPATYTQQKWCATPIGTYLAKSLTAGGWVHVSCGRLGAYK
jgi:hypothetical protein